MIVVGSTEVERALRARFQPRIQSRHGQEVAMFSYASNDSAQTT
jgi:hypothetical protein